MKSISGRLHWKVLLMSLLTNMLAIVITAVILPGLDILKVQLTYLILLGVALGLLNTFIKPILQILTIRLLFVTFGLILIVTNTIIILLLDWIFTSFSVQGLLPAILAGILISLFGLFFDYIFGVAPPIGYQQAVEEQEISHERA